MRGPYQVMRLSHFLTEEKDILKYILIASETINKNGSLTIDTFSETGPTKCSGIEITQNSAKSLAERFKSSFQLINSFPIDYKTPFETIQNFTFGVFKI